MKRIYVILILTFTCILYHAEAKSKKSSPDSPDKSTEASPAIVAIQIVDPNENSTNTKNKKRTIDEALGYGYNSYGGQSKGKYVTYKYSTHDIAPYRGPSPILSSKYKSKVHGASSPKIEITKSVEYKLPTVTQYIPPTAPAYTVSNKIEPGTTLFSTINSRGQLGDLSSDVPKNSVEYNDQPVPVIILRIYPQQLNDPQLFANLPKSNPYSSSINNVNIQNLLAQYLQALQRHNPQYQTPQHSYYTQTQRPHHVKQIYKTNTLGKITRKQKPHISQQTYYQQEITPVQQYYQQQPQTYQYYSQYPSQSQYEQPQYDQAQQYQYQQQYYQQQNVEPQYQQQEYYAQPQQVGQAYQQVGQAQQPDQTQYQQQQYAPEDYVQNHQQQQQLYQQETANGYSRPGELLTHENYPSDQHTKVLFKTTKGQIKTSQTEEPPRKEIKTIKIEVPDNIAKVEVEESERPFLPTPTPEAQSYQYQQEEQQQNVYYQNLPEEYLSQQQQYYSGEQQTQNLIEDSSAQTYPSPKSYKTRDAKPQPEIITNSDQGHVYNQYQEQQSNLQPEQNSGYNYYYQPTIQESQGISVSDSKSKSTQENYYTSDRAGSNLNQGEYYSASSTIKNPIVVADENQQSGEADQIGYSSTVSYNVAKIRGTAKKRRVKSPSSL